MIILLYDFYFYIRQFNSSFKRKIIFLLSYPLLFIYLRYNNLFNNNKIFRNKILKSDIYFEEKFPPMIESFSS